jgi:type 1 glutamine amidotransferase
MKIVASCLAVFFSSGVLFAQSAVTNRASLFKKGAIRVLILSGQNNHDWRATTPLLREMLLNTGRFDVRVNEEPSGMTSETLAPYDVVVLDYNGPRWGHQAETALENFVRSGKGLVGVHGANWAFSGLVVLGEKSIPTGIVEPAWKEYKLMLGGVWSDKDPSSGHAPRHNFAVKIVDPSNPITEGLPSSFEADDELYHNIHMAPNVHILATAYDDPKNRPGLKTARQSQDKQEAAGPPNAAKMPRLEMNPTGKDEPMLWTVRYGEGRTFYTALGHDVRAMVLPGFSTTFVRGVEWAATGTVKQPAPQFQSWSQTQLHE